MKIGQIQAKEKFSFSKTHSSHRRISARDPTAPDHRFLPSLARNGTRY
jgi:hypothetical protein